MESLFQKKYRVLSARLKGWDYSQDGYYFVTICTKNKEEFFGKIKNKEIFLSSIGKIAQKYWREILKHFPFVSLDKFVVMPNHIHGILIINNWSSKDAIYRVSTKSGGVTQKHNPMGKNSLGEIVRAYKAAVKRFSTQNKISFAWQSRYHDHIIRNDREHNDIQDYILTNVVNWNKDKENLEINFCR